MTIFNDFIGAVTQGAASVYHSVVAAESSVQLWETQHPPIAALITEATTYANDLLTRSGVPIGALIVTGKDIIVALKSLAVSDATLPSLPAQAP